MYLFGSGFLVSDVKITKYGHVLEGRAIYCSSLLPLVHPYQSLVSKGTILFYFYLYFYHFHFVRKTQNIIMGYNLQNPYVCLA